ncbi:MAG: 23S rRNA (adenine(2503)-C(2))-methyltransferase RlmN [Bdellovibrionales bacterium]|jgi:23S rRNA (adenine2503-C2)-methyltransferase|nr:23S rRNA (adenine(2503)-C(2))-methyltransferase RlmN [Bdellovibrionales bacterium]
MKQLESIYSLTIDDLRNELTDNSFAKFAADQIYSWIYKKLIFNTGEWSNVSKKIASYLSSNYSFDLPEITWNISSSDGTRKFLLKMRDGNSVEAVLIPAKNRLTLCLSTQVGCAIGCTFCHTGTMGLIRHLTAGEILGQYLSISKLLNSESKKITNIVYMGQGEPLHNFENVKKATLIFLEDFGIGLGQRKITLSTSGLVPQIEKLIDFPPVNIAISLHAAHNNIRSELMPINKRYDLERLFNAIKTIPLKAHRWITYEYLLIDGLNDRCEDIDALIKLLNKKESKVNLIPFNEYPESKFKRPSKNKIMWFQNQLNESGIICTTRSSRGDDILAACGQLKSKDNDLNIW